MCELGYSFLSLGGDGNGNISALENIFCSRYNLNGAIADINLTDDEALCIGMLLNLLNQTYADIFYLLAEKLIALYLGACIGHSVAIFLYIYIRAINKVGKPFH